MPLSQLALEEEDTDDCLYSSNGIGIAEAICRSRSILLSMSSAKDVHKYKQDIFKLEKIKA
jgi:hypothetical protein